MQACTLLRLLTEICICEDNSKLILCSCRIIGLAEALDKFRICQSPGAVDLSCIVVEILDLFIICHAVTKRVNLVKIEVTSSDHPVKRGIDGLNLGICGTDVPLPQGAECIGVSLDGINQVRLDVRAEGQVAAVEAAAHVGRVDAGQDLLGIVQALHAFGLEDGIARELLQTRSKAEGYGNHCRHPHKFHIYVLHHLHIRIRGQDRMYTGGT